MLKASWFPFQYDLMLVHVHHVQHEKFAVSFY
ncbi:hypothetical protein T4D_1018 [Trichinella pseudospiralis]|uniref:Uncharacterized protein n=1 Tax=Trichinella pseudospiralis TaxID=6337 RepID=A0A0V1DQJ0_TRIPS|nr:hypothetical protein T4D_1018 [Trichinella pseudospiralis]